MKPHWIELFTVECGKMTLNANEISTISPSDFGTDIMMKNGVLFQAYTPYQKISDELFK